MAAICFHQITDELNQDASNPWNILTCSDPPRGKMQDYKSIHRPTFAFIWKYLV